MTTVVLTPDYILADTRLTSVIKVKDQAGNEVQVRGTTDEYCKIGDFNVREPVGDSNVETYVIFGDVEAAIALVELVQAATFENIGAVLLAVGKFKVQMPKTATGIGWVTEGGKMGWLVLEDGGYHLLSAPEGTKAVALGSGKHRFDMHFADNLDVISAFQHAIANDPQSSDRVYDQWDRESGVLNRVRLPTVSSRR
jgi:hypothetical protein